MGSAESKKKYKPEITILDVHTNKQIIKTPRSTYEGIVKHGMRHGEGVYKVQLDSGTFVVYGNWIEDEITEGEIRFSNDDFYKGEIREKKCERYDVSSGTDYVIYVPYMFGEGKFTQYSTGYVLKDGHFIWDKFTGFGIHTSENGEIYEGYWLDDKYHYKGRLTKMVFNEENNTCSLIPQEGYYYNGKFLGKNITDDVYQLLFYKTEYKKCFKDDVPENTTIEEVKPDAPIVEEYVERKEQEGEQELNKINNEEPGEEQEPEEVGESEEEQELEPEEVGESEEEQELEQEVEEQKNIKLSKLQLAN